MNMKLVKRILTVTLAAALVVMPITAGATTDQSSSSSETTATASSTTQESSTPAAPAVAATSSVAGVTSQIAGAYSVKTLNGFAVRAGDAAISAAGANLAPGEKAFVRAYDITAKSSPAAWASFQGAAAGLGGRVLAALNIDLGKMSGGKFSSLAAGVTVPATVGIPGGVDAAKTYAIIHVFPGGATEILADQDTNPNTVTFNITGGLGAYALVVY